MLPLPFGALQETERGNLAVLLVFHDDTALPPLSTFPLP
jgi:hypothetical protein